MIGIFLLLLNNHRKFTDTVHNIQFTTNNLNNAKNNGNKYFSDMYGHNYDISTGHMVKKGIDKYTGHRGIIDIQTGKAVEDHIEQTILMLTENYMNGKNKNMLGKNDFSKVKAKLDARKECKTNEKLIKTKGEQYDR